ncbi:MAG: anti-sigma factor antagonist [Lachnospiraceae bacterium]|nr:anti-sigma factor antagonist [Lachnospiraceae bacterium]
MKTKFENNTLTICLEGRIDSNSAPKIEEEIFSEINKVSEAKVVLDLNELAYISSAGLRVLMKVKKEMKQDIPAVNVSPEVYEIFQTTGFTEILGVHKKLREISVEGYEKLGEGGNGAVYRIDADTIVKVYKPWMDEEIIDRERSFARTAFVNGIPSVIAFDMVRVDDCLGIVFEALNSDTLGHAMRNNPEKMPEYVDKYVELAKTLHTTHVPEGSFTRIQEVFHGYADNLGEWCTSEEIALIHSLIDSIPDADTVTHNDLHPGNIMIQDGELVLIDMPQVTMGPPIMDMVAVFRDMISAPQGDSAHHIEFSVGMPKELIVQAGNMFFMKYTGITDPAELEAYYKKLGLLYAMNVVLMPGTGAETAMKLGKGIMDKLLYPVVIPNEQAIRGLLQTM